MGVMGDQRGHADYRLARSLISVGVLSMAMTGGHDHAPAFIGATEAMMVPSWHDTGAMSMRRQGATITLLANGRVLVVGGFGPASVPLASAELYDPRTRAWSATGSMQTPRGGHTATLLATGDVLVAGGYGPSTALASAELYDPHAGKWTFAGRMHQARVGHTATLLPDGSVLVVDGTVGRAMSGLRSAEIYSAMSRTWHVTGRPMRSRIGQLAVLLRSGDVLVVGGYDVLSYRYYPLTSAELYDPHAGTWKATGSVQSVGGQSTATLLPDGRVLVVGTPPLDTLSCAVEQSCNPLISADVYTPRLGTWKSTLPMVTPRYAQVAALLSDGTVLIAGGIATSRPGSGQGPAVASAEIYTPRTGAWAATASMHQARADAMAVLLRDGTVLITGGTDASDARANATLASAEIYHNGP